MKMNMIKVTDAIYKMRKSSLRALLHTGHPDNQSAVNRNENCIRPWMICSLVLCMALIAAGFAATAAPALAADPISKIDISPVEGIAGTTVLVRASYCVKNTSVWVTFTPPSGVTGTTFTVTIKTDDNGFGSAELTVGLTPAGNYQISATDGGTVTPTPNIKFFIVNPSVTLSQAGGQVGDTVEVWGNGFTANKPIVILLDDVKMTTSETDNFGSFPNAKFTFPPSAAGKHTILAKDYVTKPVTATYTINPRMMLNPVSGCVGDTIQISAAGFPAVANVILSYEGADIATVPTDARGSIVTTFKIPPSSDALHKIKLTDGLNPVISNITVVPAMTINQSTGYVGQSVTLNGTGFRSGNALLGTYDSISLSGSTVAQDGSFSYTFRVPKSPAGLHNINVTDGVNNRTATFTMESTPPPAPGLAAPSEGARFTKDARFVWETVNDPSGVTYTIEIADDTRFTQPVISQANLVQTYLDVPDSAKTLPGKSDGYYWRVKATDGASNMGNWSVIGSFYKGVTVESVMSDMPAWTKFVLIGLGLILFAFMVIFIRRNIMRVRYSDEEDTEEYPDDEYGGELEQGNNGKGYLN